MTELHATQDVQRTLVLVLDLCGTLAFAFSGAMAGSGAASTFSASWCCRSPQRPSAA